MHKEDDDLQDDLQTETLDILLKENSGNVLSAITDGFNSDKGLADVIRRAERDPLNDVDFNGQDGGGDDDGGEGEAWLSFSGPRSGRLIREARRRAGLTQEELASFIKTAVPNVARWECGDMLPTLNMLTRIMRVCGLDVQISLVPATPGSRISSNQTSLEDRLERLIGFVDLIDDAEEAEGKTPEKKSRSMQRSWISNR